MKPVYLGLIPARGGSKGVPRKNLRDLGGRPLIAWTIETARSCPRLDRVVVSTDDPEIGAAAVRFGAEVPFTRPGELAGADVGDLPVCRHALEWLAEHEEFHPEIVVWLRPTSPLRSVEDIEGAAELLARSGADSVRSVTASAHHPYWTKRIEQEILLPFVPGHDESIYPRRQLLPPAYALNGAVDAIRTAGIPAEGLLFSGRTAAWVMPGERSVDIDSELDFVLAEALMMRSRE